MTHSAPSAPPSRYGPPPTLGVISEAGGFVATCACRWVRWWEDRKHAVQGHAAHVAKCKGPKAKGDAAPKRAAVTDWNGRKGSTWIDKL